MSHSTVVGGSSAGRVLDCPASVKLAQAMPQSPSTSYALEGTACHAIMERMLLEDDFKFEHAVGLEVDGFVITEELVLDKIIPAWEATQEAFTRFDVDEFEPEAQVHFTSVPGAFGTCDIFARGRDDLVVLLDYKFGSGILVSPVDNKQLMFYAAAAMEDPEFTAWFTGEDDQPIVVGIIQPAQENALATWETTAGDLKKFTLQLGLAIEVSNKPNLTPHAGDHCRWCPAAPVCPAKSREAHSTLSLNKELAKDLATNMALADALEPWIKSVRTLAHAQLERGDEIEGYKLVKKRAMRKWTDTTGVMKKLKNMKKLVLSDYTVSKMVTPPQLEKICKAKSVDFDQFDVYHSYVSSGTTVAAADDPRPGVTMTAAGDEIPEHLDRLMKNETA